MGASTGRWSLILAGCVVALGAGATRAFAGTPDSAGVARPWYEEITLNGFVSSSYGYNFGRPPSRSNTYRVFDFDDNTFKVDGVELVAQSVAPKPREAGFRVDVVLGGSIPRVSAARGLFRDPAGTSQDADLQQALATYVFPIGSGLQVSAGKFVTHAGAEVIEGYDGWNDDATRSFLFGYAIPFTHTGVRAAYGFGPRVSVMGMVVNGWDNATDNNRAKSVGTQLAVTPVPAFTLILNGMVGAERDGNDRHQRRLGDVVAVFKAVPELTITVNADLGQEQGLLEPARSRPAQWSGAAAYVRWQAGARFALAVRAETFDDRDGARTGLAQRLSELTLTPELRLAPRFLLRADLRRDRSNHPVFSSDSGPRDTQATLLVNVIGAF
jgi:hypothetical protein